MPRKRQASAQTMGRHERLQRPQREAATAKRTRRAQRAAVFCCAVRALCFGKKMLRASGGMVGGVVVARRAAKSTGKRRAVKMRAGKRPAHMRARNQVVVTVTSACKRGASMCAAAAAVCVVCYATAACGAVRGQVFFFFFFFRQGAVCSARCEAGVCVVWQACAAGKVGQQACAVHAACSVRRSAARCGRRQCPRAAAGAQRRPARPTPVASAWKEMVEEKRREETRREVIPRFMPPAIHQSW